MVLDAGSGLRREKVAPGGLEKVQHRLVITERELVRSITTCAPAIAPWSPRR
jgi:hypothetical protein